jgi:uncharacterized protein YciI
MARYAVVRARGPAWDAARPMRAQDAWDEHAAFMNDLAASGFIVLGGPLGDGERILLVIEAENEESVRHRLAADPWSATGRLLIESVEPWAILLERPS